MGIAPIVALGHLGIRTEASFASGGAIDNWQPFDSEDITKNQENIYGDRIQATAESTGGTPDKKTVAGTVNFGISPSNPSEWWVCGLGQSTSPYSVERPLKSMVLQIDKETAAVQASGCMINTLTISSTEGEELKCAVAIEAKDLSDVAAGSPSFASGDAPYVHSEATFKLNGVEDANIKAFSVAGNNNVADDLFGSSKTRLDIPATKLMVTGSFSKLFADTTEHNAFLAELPRSFQATFNRGAKSFDVNVNKLRYDSAPAPLSGQSDYIVEDFSWTGYVDDSSVEKSLVITVV